MPTPDNVIDLELQRACAALAGPLSKFVGGAAALEAARGFMQVQVSTEGSGDRFDPVAVARNVIQTRVDAHATYGASWKGMDVTELSTLLAFTWVDACSKDKDVEVSQADIEAAEAAERAKRGRADDVEF